MFSKKSRFSIVDKKTGKKIKTVKVNVKEENQIKLKLSETLEKINNIHGDINGLSLNELQEIIRKPEYKNIVDTSFIEIEEDLDEHEKMTRAFIIMEVFQKYGIKF